MLKRINISNDRVIKNKMDKNNKIVKIKKSCFLVKGIVYYLSLLSTQLN